MTNPSLIAQPNESQTGDDSAPIRLGVVGTNFGAGIARNLARGNRFARLAAVCDSDEAKAMALGAELRVPAYANIDRLLEDENIEAVGLFTPPHDRAKLVSRVLRAGRHVMTTKPFELDPLAAETVLEEAASLGLAVHLNSPGAVPPEDIAQIQAWARKHDLGQAIGMRAETWADYHEKPNGSWYDDPERCPAAPIFRLGIYFLNDFAMLLGEARRVLVMQTRIRTGRPTADNAQLSIEFRSGALANIFASFCIGDGKPWPDNVTINYERGTIRRHVERVGGLDMAADHAVTELLTPTVSGRGTTAPGGFAGWYDWKVFHDAIRGVKGAPLQNTDGILFGVRLLDAMRRSAISGLMEDVR